MQYRDLRDFIRGLEARGELKRIKAPVSPNLEMTEVCDRTLRKGGPALLFENPTGHSVPVLGNLFGTPKRVALGMGAEEVSELREIGKLLAFLKEPEPPKGLKDAWNKLPIFKKIISMAPNYDNNIALISRGYPSDVSRKHDGLIRFFKEFLENNTDAALMFKEMFFPVITAEIIHECISDIPLECDEEYLESFILNGQRIVSEIIRSCDTHMLQEEEESFDLKR